MAGDWIKFEHATLDKPEVLVLADYMETTADDVVGKLLRVWVWFDKNSVNGDAGGVTGSALMRFIDAHVGRNGFAACMKKVGWLTENGLPNFDYHNGETAKKRALSKDRMRKMRDADVTQEASPEKRREEKINTIGAAPKPSDSFAEFWTVWPASPRRVAKSKCADLWRRNGLDAVAAQIVSHVAAMKASEQWRKGFEPAPLTYLNQRRWEDGSPEESKPERRLAL